MSQLDGGAEAHSVSSAEEEHARIAAENRIFNELNDQSNLPLDSGSFPADIMTMIKTNKHSQKLKVLICDREQNRFSEFSICIMHFDTIVLKI